MIKTKAPSVTPAHWGYFAWLALAVGTPYASAATEGTPRSLSLAGTWRFRLDRQDAGQTQAWFKQDLPDRINLPGSLPAQGIGDDVTVDTKWTGLIVDRSFFTSPDYAAYREPGHVKVPFWLQPDKVYVGAAWYQRDIEVPQAWQGLRTVLTLERPHWETQVWLDDREIGRDNSLSTPHEYDLGAAVKPGTHQITIRVDNRLVVDVGVNSHSVTDHTQGNWNGIVGRIELLAVPPVWIEDLQVYPHVAAKSVTVKGRMGNATGKGGQGTLRLTPVPQNFSSDSRIPPSEIQVTWTASGGLFEAELPLGETVRLWDEFSPTLYQLDATLDGRHTKSVTFGLREISTQGTQFLINSRKAFMRGTLECCIFPKTGHPPTDVEAWRRIICIAKAHGLNNIRFHSWCPPEAAFVAADGLGFYYQVECASWANDSTTLGDGKPVDSWLYAEADRILKSYGNHPSFILMPYGNEPGGDRHAAYLAKWVSHYKAKDPRRLYTSASGWPQIPENQFHVAPSPRIQAWGGGLTSRINAKPPQTRTDYRDIIQAYGVPVISHEIGQWCVYPNFDEITKYTGPLKPKNFEIFRDKLNSHNLGNQARQFLLASGKLQTLCYKEDIESALRTPGMGGFQLLDLHDFPGQGTALVGVLDPFWESKGYVTPEEYSRFCNSTVMLARMSKRVFTTDETLEADLEVAHFGPAPLENAVTRWRLVSDSGKTVVRGSLPAKTIPLDSGIALGGVNIDLKTAPAPARYKLVVGLAGTKFENDWDVWVYAPKVDTAVPAEITVLDDMDDKALAATNSGGKVLLQIPPGRVKGDGLGKVALGFSSIFWNTAWTARQAPHTLGILCDPNHPLFAAFPTDAHSNWQWWYLVSRAEAMILDGLPAPLRPTVQVIDDWFTARKLGLVFEAKVGKAKFVVCSIDLKNTDGNPVARQFRASLLAYMATPRFDPQISVDRGALAGILARDVPSSPASLGPKAEDTVWLSSLDLSKIHQGWGKAEVDKAVTGKPLSVGGKQFEQGVGTHAKSMLWIDLHGGTARFLASVGVDDAAGGAASIAFKVVGDGKKLWDSGLMKAGQAAKPVELDVKGVKTLLLQVTDGGDGTSYDHADWCEARFLVSGTRPRAIDRPGPWDEKVILTPRPGPAPRINGPAIYGCRPGNPFVYRIPCTGERPMTFSAQGLPAGLTLNAALGIITGTNPPRGEYAVKLIAANRHGKAERDFRIVSGDTLALTPPMGWNHWYAHYNKVTDKMMREAADVMVSTGMADVGYHYVNIDDCWMNATKHDDPLRVGPLRDDRGNIIPNKHFPDMKALTEYIHSKGLKAGLYTSPGPLTCAGFAGSGQHEAQDAKQFADWGFDFLKHDWCSYSQVAGEDHSLAAMKKPYQLMGDLLKGQSRDIVFNLCQYGMGQVWEWGAEVGGHCWRTAGDLGFELDRVFEVALKNAEHRIWSKPGAWNDPDYIQIGYIGDAQTNGEPRPCPLAPNEQYAFMSLWCLMAAPLFYSGDMARLDEFTLNVLCNPEVIEVDQDPLGQCAKVVALTEDTFLMVKDMEDGSKAAGLFNTGEFPADITAPWSAVGVSGPCAVRDLWRQKELGTMEARISTLVPPRGVVMLRLRAAAGQH